MTRPADFGGRPLPKSFRRISLLALTLIRAFDRAKPHYLRDYNFVLARLLAANPYERAMQLCVGGDYDECGHKLAALLAHLGLKDQQFVVDVGCGSGRLSSALARRFDIRYHGTDILAPLLHYARMRAPASYRFTQIDCIGIPEESDSADFVTFFSVATHLMHHETYIYLKEAQRVAKPGGQIVVSFLEFANPDHWPIFDNTVRAYRQRIPEHLNAFIEGSVFPIWARKLGLELIAIHPGDRSWIPITKASGLDEEEEALIGLGQSCAILRKPA
jgi:ubiquinone/menaquinone biosynthesis C-methylase UbiE